MLETCTASCNQEDVQVQFVKAEAYEWTAQWQDKGKAGHHLACLLHDPFKVFLSQGWPGCKASMNIQSVPV